MSESPIQIEAPWLSAMVDQRVALMVEHGALEIARENGTLLVMSLLDEGDEEMTDEQRERWERTCDNCGKYVPPEPERGRDGYTGFYTGYTARRIEGVQIMLAFGVCGTCKDAHTTKGNEK